MEREIQEILFEFFKDVPNSQFVKFVDCFVYDDPGNNLDPKVSELLEKFLEENDLVEAHLNYFKELREPQEFFRRLSDSDLKMIQTIKTSLLSVAFNKFRRLV